MFMERSRYTEESEVIERFEEVKVDKMSSKMSNESETAEDLLKQSRVS